AAHACCPVVAHPTSALAPPQCDRSASRQPRISRHRPPSSGSEFSPTIHSRETRWTPRETVPGACWLDSVPATTLAHPAAIDRLLRADHPQVGPPVRRGRL